MVYRKHFGVLLTLLMAFGAAHAAGTLEVSNAWIPQAPPGASAMAGYLDLKNSGDQTVGVVSARSDRFGEVSLHQTIVEDGMARMRPLKDVTIDPGKTFTFAPGGNHLMLMDPVSTVAPGDSVSIDFELSDGQHVKAVFTVRSADETAGDAHEHHH
ncbi:copper chaperone PCu(A)C [Dokdonella sp.]|uniref:copper chaperone PCu(A)C n=1 Tax=Dokdonella sp. TaxID=2291710 RepID=UPI003C313E2D